MNAKRSVYILALALVLALGLAACSRARDDAQIASEVQQKVFSDPAVQSRQITVRSANGVVTLSGTVASENERTAAASQAAQVAGVKTVVNNLEVAPATTAQEQPAPPAEATPVEEPASRAAAPRHRTTLLKPRAARPVQDISDTTTTASGRTMPTTLTPPADTQPASPPRKVTVPEGTVLSVRLVDPIDSEKNQVGDSFHATLDAPVTIDGDVVIPANADIMGRVVESKKAGHYAGKPEIALELTSLKVNNNSYTLRTNQFTRQGTSRGAQTAKRVGAGAAIGAIIGGIAGGGKGAAIGGTIGAGAGGGVQTATKAEQVKLPSESLLSFELQSPVTVYAAAKVDSSRQKLPE